MISDFLIFSMANEAGMEGIPVRKLICDCCGKEIDTSYMDKYDMHPKAHLSVYGEIKDQTYGTLDYDLCQFCTQKVVDCIKFNKDLEKSV